MKVSAYDVRRSDDGRLWIVTDEYGSERAVSNLEFLPDLIQAIALTRLFLATGARDGMTPQEWTQFHMR